MDHAVPGSGDEESHTVLVFLYKWVKLLTLKPAEKPSLHSVYCMPLHFDFKHSWYVHNKVIHAWICVTQVTRRMGVITVHGVFGGCFISSVLVSLLLATNSAIPPGLFSGTLVPLLQLQTMSLKWCLSDSLVPACDLLPDPWSMWSMFYSIPIMSDRAKKPQYSM